MGRHPISLNYATGQKFNDLILVSEFLDDSNKSPSKRRWLTKCSCGRNVIILARTLSNKKIYHSCRLGICHPNFKDLKGKKFGKLTVLSFAENKNRNNLWLCGCSCGNSVIVSSGRLISGNVKSCKRGCYLRLLNKEAIVKKAYRTHKKSAEKRNLKSYLTYKKYKEIANMPCVYCNCFSIRTNPNTKETMQLNSVDRKNNEPFYKLSNSQSVCFDCQEMKMSRMDREFVDKICEIYNFIKNKIAFDSKSIP